MTLFTIPSLARWLRPFVPPSPCPAAYTSVRSFGAPVSAKLSSRAISSSSGTPMPTKPPVATVSPFTITRAAAFAEITLLRFT